MTRRPAFVPDAIPATLRDVPRWVVWRYETRDGNATKMPYDARSGRRAAVDRPAAWSPFADALSAYRDAGYAGCGIVLNGDGLVALDYDDCIADDGTIAPDVAADLAALNTYAERSPSTRGIRAFVVGDLPDGVAGKRRRGFEVYASGRYVTVTGDRIADAPDTIADGGDALRAIYARRIAVDDQPRQTQSERPPQTRSSLSADDETIVRRLLTIPAAAALYRGDTTRYDGDESRADAALCCHLVYCGADAQQISRIVAASGLSRSKWSRDDYRERTIAYAFRVTGDRYDQRDGIAVLTVDGAPMRPEQPQEDGAAPVVALLDSDADELRRLRFEVDRLRLERDRAVAERDHANQTIRAVLTIIRNSHLGAARVTGAATVIALASATDSTTQDGMHQRSTKEIAANAGVSPSAVSRHLRKIAKLPDSPLRHEIRLLPNVDRETGEILGPPREWTFIGMTTATIDDYATGLAALKIPDAERHGGTREAVAPACPDHPTAGAVLRAAYTIECADCARTLKRGDRIPQRIAADQLARPVAIADRAALQDATRELPTHSVIDVSLHAQDATRHDFDADHDTRRDPALHHATAQSPLLPPSRSEIAARYTA